MLRIYDKSALDHLGDKAPLCDMCDSLGPCASGYISRCAGHLTAGMRAALEAGCFEIVAKLLPGASVVAGEILTISGEGPR